MNKYQYRVQGVDYDVEIVQIEDNVAKVTVNGIAFEVEMKQPVIGSVSHIGKPAAVPAAHTDEPAPVAQNPKARPVSSPTSTDGITAPLPGTITDVKVKVGDRVTIGQVVIVLEAMKMQNDIESDYDGVVKTIEVEKGDAVMEGTVLLTIG